MKTLLIVRQDQYLRWVVYRVGTVHDAVASFDTEAEAIAFVDGAEMACRLNWDKF